LCPHARALAGVFVLAAVAAPVRGALGPIYGGEIVVALDRLPARFEPGRAHDAAARAVSALVHERLVEVGADGVPYPALAERWARSADGREWTIRLRSGAAFHDGAPVTTADAVRSLRRFLRSPTPAADRLADALDGGSAYRGGTTDELAGIAGGDGTVTLRLRKPSAIVLSTLASPAAAITGARGAAAGPFVPTTASPIRGRARFVAFAGHVRGRPFLDTVVLATVPDAADRDLTTVDGPRRSDVRPAIEAASATGTLLLVLDPRHPPLGTLEARRGLAAAVDGGDLVRHFLPGAAPTSFLLSAALLPFPLDPPPPRPGRGAPGALALAVSRDVLPDVSQRVVAYLGAAGLQATARVAVPDEVWTVPAAARLVVFAPEIPDALLALDELAASAPFADTPSARELRDRAAGEGDRDRRDALVRRAEAEMRAGGLLLPLAVIPLGTKSRPGVHGVTVDVAVRIRLEDAWIAP
jgi:MarR-like DNA-binding transcriptional regulator SgrR of sgrS sRNA